MGEDGGIFLPINVAAVSSWPCETRTVVPGKTTDVSNRPVTSTGSAADEDFATVGAGKADSLWPVIVFESAGFSTAIDSIVVDGRRLSCNLTALGAVGGLGSAFPVIELAPINGTRSGIALTVAFAMEGGALADATSETGAVEGGAGRAPHTLGKGATLSAGLKLREPKAGTCGACGGGEAPRDPP